VVTTLHRSESIKRELGTIVKPKSISDEDLYQLIADAESTLIYLMGIR
jgi:hypothetical protein